MTSPLLACFPPDPCKVIVGAGHALYAFDLNGKRLRAAVLAGGDISKGGAVTIDAPNRRVAAAAGGTLYALNAADGSVVWSRALSRTALTDPAAGNPTFVHSPRILVGDQGGTLYSVDPGTGAVVSRFAAGGPITAPPAIGDPNLSPAWVLPAHPRPTPHDTRQGGRKCRRLVTMRRWWAPAWAGCSRPARWPIHTGG